MLPFPEVFSAPNLLQHTAWRTFSMKGEIPMPPRLADERGFTLTELLVVVGIIVLLTAIVVPNIVGRIDAAKMHAAEDQIAEIETALAAYYADFGTYPGDVFPTEDRNNDGVLEPSEDSNFNNSLDAGEDKNSNSVLDLYEDTGVDIDGDGYYDYACNTDGTGRSNGRLDRGDGVINIDDLEWALKTTAKNGPYIKEIPLDPWGNRYVYYAPLRRPTYNSNDLNDRGDEDYLWIDPANNDSPPTLNDRTLCSEDINGNGRLDTGEDVGIAVYDVNTGVATVYVRTAATPGGVPAFTSMRAGSGNGILDHGDDDNKNNNIETYIDMATPEAPNHIELGNADISPDGLARNIGYYIYSIGRDKRDQTATGYEDIELNGMINGVLDIDPSTTFDEDLDADGSLDCGYEDVGLDGIPGTKDQGEDDGELTVGTGGDTRDEDFDGDSELDGQDNDDINSWNKKRPWRSHSNYGG